MDYRENLEDLAERSRRGDPQARVVLHKELEAPLDRLAQREARLEHERARRINERRRSGQPIFENDSYVHFDESSWLMKRLVHELCRKAAANPRCETFPDPHGETVRIY